MIKKVFANTIYQIIGKAFTATSSLIVTILIGKTLGPAGYGQFTQIFVFVGYFYTIVDFGFNALFVKDSSSNDEIERLRLLIGLRTLLASLFSITAVIISFLLPYNEITQTGFAPTVRIGIAIGALTILTHALFTSSNAFFQKKLSYKFSALASVASAITTLATAVLITLSFKNLYGYVFAYVFGGISLVLTAFILLYANTGTIIIPKINISEWTKLIKSSWPVGTALLFNLIYFRIDVFILSNFRPAYEVGLYGLSYQIFESSLALPIFLTNSIYPFLVDAAKKSISDLSKTVRFWLVILFLISIVLIFFLITISYLIELVDARFGPSRLALIILSLGVPFFFLSAVLWNSLIAAGRQKFLLLIYAFGAAFNVAANFLTIHSFGYLAAAANTIVSEGIILLLLALSYLKIRREEK